MMKVLLVLIILSVGFTSAAPRGDGGGYSRRGGGRGGGGRRGGQSQNCHIVYDEIIEQKCTTKNERVCTTRYETKCSNRNICTTKEECTYQEHCITQNQCKDVKYKKCEFHWAVNSYGDKIWEENPNNCQWLWRTQCEDVPLCQNVPSCHQVPVCKQVQDCKQVPINECKYVPKKWCQPVHKRIPRQVCTGGGGGGHGGGGIGHGGGSGGHGSGYGGGSGGHGSGYGGGSGGQECGGEETVDAGGGFGSCVTSCGCPPCAPFCSANGFCQADRAYQNEKPACPHSQRCPQYVNKPISCW